MTLKFGMNFFPMYVEFANRYIKLNGRLKHLSITQIIKPSLGYFLPTCRGDPLCSQSGSLLGLHFLLLVTKSHGTTTIVCVLLHYIQCFLEGNFFGSIVNLSALQYIVVVQGEL
jgi:hypothetical protein